MKNPHFNIQIASNSLNTKVFYDETDITSSIRSIRIYQVAGDLPIVTLELTRGQHGASVSLDAECIIRLHKELEAQKSAPKNTLKYVKIHPNTL